MHAGLPVLGGLGGEDAEGFEGGVRCGKVGEAFVDQLVRQRGRVVESGGQCPCTSKGEEGGGVGAFRQLGVARVVAVGAEDPVVAFGGDAAGEVGVRGDDRRPVTVLAVPAAALAR